MNLVEKVSSSLSSIRYLSILLLPLFHHPVQFVLCIGNEGTKGSRQRVLEIFFRRRHYTRVKLGQTIIIELSAVSTSSHSHGRAARTYRPPFIGV